MLPAEIVAIDWGATPRKRQACRAVLRGPRYCIEAPVMVGDPASLEFRPATLTAFDCALGLPAPYSAAAGLTSFREALGHLGQPPFERFFEPASRAEEISVHRPFYPARSPGSTRAAHRDALGEIAFALRDCDRATDAGPLFWLVGPRQVGRSAITVWREVLRPRLDEVSLWPFDGPLASLLESGRPVVAEMYPAFLLRTLGLSVRSKREQAARAECGRELLEKVRGLDLIAVRDLLLDGFGSSPAGEDAFDATVSCIALVKLAVAGHIPEPPEEARLVEGWILGL